TSYRFGNVPARPFLYPLIDPYGHPMTRRPARPEDRDMDHHHHRSVWVSYGDVNGIDNWSEASGHGCTVHRTFDSLESGAVFGRFRAVADWVGPDGRNVLEEVKEVTIYNLPSSGRLIDLDVSLRAIEGDVLFGDTKEGGIVSVRVLPSMEVRHGGRIENNYGGVNEGETWGKRAHWCDYSGSAEGNIVGIAIFDSPKSFRYPTYWHVRDYGLMTANPFGLSYFYNDPHHRGDHTLPAGETLFFSYRLYIHPGDATQARVAERYHDFINPPVIKVEE
ncbi:MAG: PmoA family protein, partial [Candidatus Latescibacteria bacterium]|nr:PmoA family protein [Candidatus Latescibacterota bacterium]